MTETQQKRPGRPPKHDESMYERINIRLPREMMAAIERMQSERMDKPDKATIVRELLAKAILADQK